MADNGTRSDLMMQDWSDAQIRERAVAATGMSFTVADARQPDQPLIWVNPAFTSTTGYSFDEAVGRNCRFLQGESTDPADPLLLRAALDAGADVTLTLLNYRKNGSTFWNEVTISPVLDADGTLTHFVGIQADVTTRVEASAERDRALEAERRAVRDAELARGRLALLAEASSELAVTLDVEETLQRLAELLVPAMADGVLIHQASEDGSMHPAPIEHGTVLPITAHASAPELWAGRASWLSDEADSTLFVALPGRDRIVGSMVLARGAERAGFGSDDLQVAIDLGRRAGLTIDNTRLYQIEHRIAETLQRSLLPLLPEVPGLEIAARYQASENGIQVGGDFYDVFALPDGAIAMVIGDVVGHDLGAAAAMGHLRGLIRAVAWDAESPERADPAAILARVDRVVQGLHVVPLATLTYARLERGSDEGWTLRHASAGHPPILLRTPDGAAHYLAGVPGLLLGFRPSERITSGTQLLPGSTLLAFTDGLVERRGEDIDAGLDRLRAVVEQAPTDGSAEKLCDHVINELADGDDDTALLVVRI